MWEYSDILEILKKENNSKAVFKAIDFENNKKYSIDSKNVFNFYKRYAHSLFFKDMTEWDQEPIFTLGEVSDDYIPIISEFIFNFDTKTLNNYDDESFYNTKLFHKIISIHQDLIKELFIITAQCSELICVVCESLAGNKSIKLKLQFPYCRADKLFINTTFRNRLIKSLNQYNLAVFFNVEPKGTWESRVSYVKDAYPLYGSSDDPCQPPVVFLGVFGEMEEEFCKEYSIDAIYDSNNHYFFSSNKCIVETDDTLQGEVDDDYERSLLLLPLFLSLYFWPTRCSVKNEIKNISEERSSSTPSSEKDTEEMEIDNLTPYEMFLDLVDCLSPKRFNQELYLLDIGKSLYNCFNGSREGLDAWSKFTNERSDNFSSDFCREKYFTFEEEFITVKTIGWYAREDNKKRYQSWHERWCIPKLKQCISRKRFPHVLTAEAFYRVFWLDYVYTGRKWVEFRNNRLVILENDEPIRRAITEKFVPCFDKLRNQISIEKISINDKLASSNSAKRMATDFEKIIVTIGEMIDKLLSDGYRNSLMRTIKEYFFIENFYSYIDMDPRLLGVYNCVIELSEKEAFVRPGKPEDFITKRLGVSYRSEYSYNHKDIIDLLRYFRQVFPETSLNEHMKKDISSMLYGRNSEKCFRLWIGDTNGSKSVFQKMLRKMFGDYYKDMPADFYSAHQRGTSGPNPELAQTLGARLVFSAEPDDDAAFKGARIKKLTGGDSFYARGCNENGGTIETTFKPIMVLNMVPDVTGLDEATKDRFKMIPFEGRWIKDGEDVKVPETFEEQVSKRIYNMDDRFEDNIPRLSMALLWLSVKNFKKYRSEGLVTPPYIKKWMGDYWRRNDPYMSYINEKLTRMKVKKICVMCKEEEKCNSCDSTGYIDIIDENFSLRSKDVFPDFKSWIRDTHPHLPSINQGKFTTLMSTTDKLGKQLKWKWVGWKLKTNEILE